MAGHYPALLLGAPWWFFDSPLGMRRYLDAVMETAGLYNTAGFNDDTRAFASIPSRHDVWRRVSCDWLAGMVLTGMVDEEEARDMAREFAYGLTRGHTDSNVILSAVSEEGKGGTYDTGSILPPGEVAVVTGATGVLGGEMARPPRP